MNSKLTQYALLYQKYANCEIHNIESKCIHFVINFSLNPIISPD